LAGLKLYADMHSAEVLSQLRALNWLNKESRSLSKRSPQRRLLESQAKAMHYQLPTAISKHHDRIASRGKSSLVAAAGSSCGACQMKLPPRIIDELKVSGRFAVCPSCEVLVCSAEDMEAELNSLLAVKKGHRG
jgi:predicted  nucleic acid-binding Zn-ribbon protein